MPQILSTLKAVGKNRLLRRNSIKTFSWYRNSYHNNVGQIGNYAGVRSLSSIAGIDCYSRYINRNHIHNNNYYYNIRWWNGNEKLQRRWFLGCGDGEEGSALSKIHEENLIIGYSPEQLFAVVAAVEFYEDFLPWCQRSDIVRRFPDGSFNAELQIGFKFLVESYVSHVVIDKPNLIKTTASESNLFEHLINVWEFSPGPTPDTCSVHFLVDFKFRSPLYRQVASMFFKEVVSRLVSSFIDRCRLLYGPGASIEQKA